MQLANILTLVERQLLQNALQNDLTMLYRKRIQIMLLADTGQSQSQISQKLECSTETVRFWTCMASSGKAHRWNDYPVGRPKIVNDQYLEQLKELASRSPREYGYSFHNWTAQWLGKHLAHELGIEVGARHINKLLKKMGLSTRRSKFVNANLVTNI